MSFMCLGQLKKMMLQNLEVTMKYHSNLQEENLVEAYKKGLITLEDFLRLWGQNANG